MAPSNSQYIMRKMIWFLSSLLVIFPLLPKLPLAGLVPGYIVFLRIEDLLVLVGGILWLWQWRKNKIKVPGEFLVGLGIYAFIGLISILVAIFIQQSIPLSAPHILKSGLHWLRYIEYAVVFLFFFSWVKRQSDFNKLWRVIDCSVIGVAIYAFGQKYWHWPLFSTMNREFSKGQLLYLSEGVRPQSTFAGPYDLGGWLVLILPIIFARLINNWSNRRERWWLTIVQLFGLATLFLSGAKTAMFACLAAYMMLLLLSWSDRAGKTWKKIYVWGGLVFILLSIVALVYGQPLRTHLMRMFSGTEDTAKPTDLVGEGHDTKGGSEWSANALKYGLSMGIRLDSLWPQAWRGFLNNPLTGNGYGTLNKIEVAQFTEADSTDNFYLRSMGETGLAGFLAFYGLVALLLVKTAKMQHLDDKSKGLNFGLLAGVLGLIINALYLDIFAASKVAFSFWAVAGLIANQQKKLDQWLSLESALQLAKKYWRKYRGLIIGLSAIFFLLHQNPGAEWSQLKNLSADESRIESLTTARCWVNFGQWRVCSSAGEGWRAPVDIGAWLNSFIFHWQLAPANFYYLNLILAVLLVLSLFVWLRRLQPAPITPFLLLALALYLLNWTSQPLNNQVLLLGLLATIAIAFTSSKLAKFNSNKFNFLLMAIVIVFSLTPSHLVNFRNNQRPLRFEAVQLFNRFFNNDQPAMPSNQTYLITAANPLQLDFYKNDQYQLLPLDQTQTNFARGSQLWPINPNQSLIDQFSQLLQSTPAVFVTNLDVNQPALIDSFQQIRDTFQLQYEVIFCDEQCNILRVHQPYPIIAQQPPTLNGLPVELNWTGGEFKYLVLEQSFAPQADKKPETLQEFINRLHTLELDQYQLLVIKGDYLAGQDSSQAELFQQLTADLPVPILYTPGNLEYQPKKFGPVQDFAFFTGNTYFLFLAPVHDSVELQQRQIFAYNRLLELEKLPQIKKLVVFGPNFELAEKPEYKAVWQNRFQDKVINMQITVKVN